MATSLLRSPKVLISCIMALLASAPAFAKPPKLPAAVAVPELNQSAAPQAEQAARQPATATADAPVPEKRPDLPADAPPPAPPEAAPKPTAKPDTSEQPASAKPMPAPEQKPAGTKNPVQPDPRSAVIPEDKLPPEEVACRDRLRTLGVEFEDHKPEKDETIGCSIPYPVAIKTLGANIAIGPETLLNCQMAEAAARFTKEVIAPAAKTELGSDLKSVDQASAYVCRPRHSGGKMSEHAFGNALDIAGFNLVDGRTVAVKAGAPGKEQTFLDAVRKAACGPFKTVLGPGSDPDHALHFHLDLEPRRNGGTFCQ